VPSDEAKITFRWERSKLAPLTTAVSVTRPPAFFVVVR
jgi:hypothetical protein